MMTESKVELKAKKTPKKQHEIKKTEIFIHDLCTDRNVIVNYTVINNFFHKISHNFVVISIVE